MLILFVASVSAARLSQGAFTPFAAKSNLIHVGTADFDGVGARDFVVAADVDGGISAFAPPAMPASTQRYAPGERQWRTETGSFAFMLAAAKLSLVNRSRDFVLAPAADGRLRVLDRAGQIAAEVQVGSGACYCADAGFTAEGESRIVAGGVDGHLYVFNGTGVGAGTATSLPLTGRIHFAKSKNATSIVRRVVVGDFDGSGLRNQAAVFYNTGGFRGNGYVAFLSLDTLLPPPWWNLTTAAIDDVTSLGWTDKQLPSAFDMDGDGSDELVAHWGVLHPATALAEARGATTAGTGSQAPTLSSMLTFGEKLRYSDEYDAVYPFTNTNKYVMQKGVPGRFKAAGSTGMVTVYGDDLYHFAYRIKDGPIGDKGPKFRADDYAYAHTLFHFTDGARLESRDPSSPLDKLVLSGPNNGDDRFYVVDLAAGNGKAWSEQAKTLDQAPGGALVDIRRTLDNMSRAIDSFSGPAAQGGSIRWIQPVNGTATGWKKNPAEMKVAADAARDAMAATYKEYFGTTTPRKVTIYTDISLDVSKRINTSCAVRWVSALAKRGVHMQILIGHGSRVFVTPEEAAQIYQASVVGNQSFVLFATKELQDPSDPLQYAAVMDALRAAAKPLGMDPAKVMLSFKGAVITGMNRTQFDRFKTYADVVILGAENSNVRVNEWCLAERASLWLTGTFPEWSGNPIGDHIATNRISEWSAMRNGHIVLRTLLSTFALGATVFRSDCTIPYENPLYLRNDTTDPALRLASPYRQGIVPFLRLVEAGVLPAAPLPAQIKGVSPVSLAVPSPSSRFKDQSIFHDFNRYAAAPKQYAVNDLECWNAYKRVSDVDITAIAHGSTRRWDSLFPHSPSGFVPLVPFATRGDLENMEFCNRSFETDVDEWAEFGSNLTAARDAVAGEILRQRDENALIAVIPDPSEDDPDSGNCYWQLTEAAIEGRQDMERATGVLFLVMLDPGALSPADRRVSLRLGGQGVRLGMRFDVFDQLGSQTTPIGRLSASGEGNGGSVSVTIPAGSARFFTLRPV